MAENLRATYESRVAAESSGLRKILADQKRFGVSVRVVSACLPAQTFLISAHHNTGPRWIASSFEREIGQ